jgi:hypothetical protein
VLKYFKNICFNAFDKRFIYRSNDNILKINEAESQRTRKCIRQLIFQVVLSRTDNHSFSLQPPSITYSKNSLTSMERKALGRIPHNNLIIVRVRKDAVPLAAVKSRLVITLTIT